LPPRFALAVRLWKDPDVPGDKKASCIRFESVTFQFSSGPFPIGEQSWKIAESSGQAFVTVLSIQALEIVASSYSGEGEAVASRQMDCGFGRGKEPLSEDRALGKAANPLPGVTGNRSREDEWFPCAKRLPSRPEQLTVAYEFILNQLVVMRL
jgi:hypothetical protein